MAQAFNLTAQLNLRGPANIKDIVADIKKQIGTVEGTVKFTIDAKSVRSVTQLDSALKQLNTTFSQTQTSATSAANAVRTFHSAVGNIANVANNTNRNLQATANSAQNLTKTTNQVSKSVSKASSEMEEFGKQSALAVRRFLAFSVSAGAIYSVTGAISKGIKEFVAYDKQLVKLQQITGKSAKELSGLSAEVTNLSKTFGVASSDLISVASTLAQAGLSARDTERALKALALTDLAPSFDSLNDTVEGSIALMRQFGIEAKDLEKALGSVNSVAAAFAVEASDLIAAIQRTGGVFASASKGVSSGTDALNEFLAIFTSVRQTTRESAETIATGLRTIFTRIQRESTIEALREFGVTLTDLEGKFVGPFEAIKRLSEGLSSLDPRDLKFSQIVEELGGFRQIGKVIPLIQQFAVAQEALGVAQAGQGSLSRDAIKAQLSLANQMAKVREQFVGLMREIGESDTFQAIAKSALNFASVLIKIGSVMKGVLPVLAIMGAGKIASAATEYVGGFVSGLTKGPDGKNAKQQQQTNTFLGAASTSSQTNTSIREIIVLTNALENNSNAVNNSTNAIQVLTSSIDALAQVVIRNQRSGPGGGGASTLNQGGKVLGFARGGVVPGTGDRDTVPAMLQPGEFVIRKKAVETIGADRLHKMNKYAGGGEVYKSPKKYGMLIAEEGNPDDVDEWSWEDKKNKKTYKAGIRISGFTRAGDFNEKTKSLDSTIDNLSKDLGESIGVTELNPKGTSIAKGIMSTVKGKMFENYVLTAAGLPDPGNAPFDIKKSNKALKGYTDESVTGLTDIKLTDNKKQRSSIIKKAVAEDADSFKKVSQKKSLGGYIQKFFDGGWVKRMQKTPKSQLAVDVENLEYWIGKIEKNTDATTGWSRTYKGTNTEEVDLQELIARKNAIIEFAQSLSAKKAKSGLKGSEEYEPEELLDAVKLYQGGSGPLTRAMVNNDLLFVDRDEQYDTEDVVNRLKAASQYSTGRKKLYSGLGRGQFYEILRDVGIDQKEYDENGINDKTVQQMVGKIIDFSTFLSTSYDKSVAEAFIGSPGGLMDISTAKSQTKGIDIDKAKATKDPGKRREGRELPGLSKIKQSKLLKYDDEKEFVLPPNTQFKIKKAVNQQIIGTNDKGEQFTLEDYDYFGIDPDEDGGTLELPFSNRSRRDRVVDLSVQMLGEGGTAGSLTGIYDSDKIQGGTKVKKALLDQLKASGKAYEVIHGPAGSGKTTLASQRYGENFVLSPEDLAKYERFVVLSGAGATKSGEFSEDVQGLMSGASGITALMPGEERLSAQRQKRVDEAILGNIQDTRSVSQLQGTLKAPASVSKSLFEKFKGVNYLEEYAVGGEVERLAAKFKLGKASSGWWKGKFRDQDILWDMANRKTAYNADDGSSIDISSLPVSLKKTWDYQAQTELDEYRKYKSMVRGAAQTPKTKAEEEYGKVVESSVLSSAQRMAEKKKKEELEKLAGRGGRFTGDYEPTRARQQSKIDRMTPDERKQYYARKLNGYIDGSTVTDEQPSSYLDRLIQDIAELGGPKEVRRLAGIPVGDLRARKALNANSIKANKDTAYAESLIKKAKEVSKADAEQKANDISLANKFALVGVYPLGYNKSFGPLDIGGKSTFYSATALGTEFQPEIDEMRKVADEAPSNAMKSIQMKKIFSSKPLALDLDDTLITGADIYKPGSAGDPDIPAYSDVDRVTEALQNARLTQLGEELKTRLKDDPSLLDDIRILTARPQNNADAISQRLQQLGLAISSDKITGVSGASNKVDNLTDLETLIDDRLETISGAIKKGKKGIGYSEISGYDPNRVASKRNAEMIEAYIAEEMLTRIGIDLPADAESNRSIDFPNGLGTAASFWGIDPFIPTDIKRTMDGSAFDRFRDEIARFYEENAERYAKGGSAEDTVPALLTPGEFVINKKAAKQIGYSRLNKLNHADKVKGYNRGGPVGPIQKFAEGGLPRSFDVGAQNTSQFNPVFGGGKDLISDKYVGQLEKSINAVSSVFNAMALTIPDKIGRAFDFLRKSVFGGSDSIDAMSESLARIEKDAPGLAQALIDNGIVNRRSIMAQNSLLAAVENTIATMSQEGVNWSTYAETLKQELEANTSSIIGPAAAPEPEPSDPGPAQRNLGSETEKLQSQRFQIKAKNEEAGNLAERLSDSSTTDDEREAINARISEIQTEIDGLVESVVATTREFTTLTEDISAFNSDLENAEKQILDSIKQQYEDITGRVPSEAEVQKIYESAINSSGRVALKNPNGNEIGKIDVRDSVRDRKNAIDNRQNRESELSAKFGDARELSDLRASPSDFIANKQAQLATEQQNKADLQSRASTATGGERAVLNDQIQQTDAKIQEINAAIESARAAYEAFAASIERANNDEARAQAELDAAEQEMIDAIRRRTTNFDALDDDQKARIVEQATTTGEISGKGADGSTQTKSFENERQQIDRARAAVEAARLDRERAQREIGVPPGSPAGTPPGSPPGTPPGSPPSTTPGSSDGGSSTKYRDAAKTKSLEKEFLRLASAQDTVSTGLRAKLQPGFKAVGEQINAGDYEGAAKTLAEVRKQMGNVAKIDISSSDFMIDPSIIQTPQDAIKVYEEMTERIDRLKESGQEITPDLQNVIDAFENLGETLDSTATDAEKVAAAQAAARTATGASGQVTGIDANAKKMAAIQSGLNKTALGIAAAGATFKEFMGTNSKEGAVAGAVVGGASQTIGAGMSLASSALSLPPPIGPAVAGIVAAGTAAVAIVGGFKDAYNAAIEFEKALATKNVEKAMDKVASAFTEFEKNIKQVNLLDDIKTQLNMAGTSLSRKQELDNAPKADWLNSLDLLVSGTSDKGARERSQILQEKGSFAYVKSLFNESYRSQVIGEQSGERATSRAKEFQPVADQTLRLFEAKLRTGTSMEDVMAELSDGVGGAPTQLAENIALANPVIQEMINNIENSSVIAEENKQAEIDKLIANEASRKSMIALEATLRAIEIEKLNKGISNFSNSLDRSFKQMEAAIGRASFELENMSMASEAFNNALSGSAQSSKVNLKSANVLQNSRAYSNSELDTAASQASSFFGPLSSDMKGLLTIGDKLEDNILSTINRTLQENQGASEETVGAKVRTSVNTTVRESGLSSDLSSKLATEIQKAVTDIRKEGDKGNVSLDQLVERVPALGKAVDSVRKAQELASKALEYWQNQLNDYANAMNQSMEMLLEANSKGRRASDIQIKGALDLQRALGKEITLRQQVNVRLREVANQTGGATNPQDIGRNIENLNNNRAAFQGMSDTAANRGVSGKDEFVAMQGRLRSTNMALRENYDALKNMAENTDIASAALSKISELQQKNQAGVNFAERMVTSSPEELSKLNSAMGRLSNNMAGVSNVGTTAEQRKESLDAFNMIAPMLGPDQGAMKANVLESMLQESGVGVNPMMQDVLNSLRNPEEDPLMREAIETYKMGVNLQSDANTELSRLSQLMANNTSEVAAEKIAQSLTKVTLNFESQTLSDIRDGIRQLVAFEEKNANNDGAVAVGKASGGIIYASAGQMVNFTPKGTDTVPAMLTPGEFVVNRAATQKNLPLLKSINSNRYSSGGKVQYYDKGGYVDFSSSSGPENVENAASRTNKNTETVAEFISPESIKNADNKKDYFSFEKLNLIASNSDGSAILSDYFYNNEQNPNPRWGNIKPYIVGAPTSNAIKSVKYATASAIYKAQAGAAFIPGAYFAAKIGMEYGTGPGRDLGLTVNGRKRARQELMESGKGYVDLMGENMEATKFLDDIVVSQPSKEVSISLPDVSKKIKRRRILQSEVEKYKEKLKAAMPDNQEIEYIKNIKPIDSSIKMREPNLTGLSDGYRLENLVQSYGAEGDLHGIFPEANRVGGSQSYTPSFYGFRVSTIDPIHMGMGRLASGSDVNSISIGGGTYFDIEKLMASESKDTQQSAIDLYTEIQSAYDEFNKGVKYEESAASIQNKKYFRLLEELYDGVRFSATLPNNSMPEKYNTTGQVTMFSDRMTDDMWKSIEKALDESKAIQQFATVAKYDQYNAKIKGEQKNLPFLTEEQTSNDAVQDILNNLAAQESEKGPKNVIKLASELYDDGRYAFTYNKLKSRFFDDTTRSFVGDLKNLKEFIVVQRQSDKSAELNPFSDLPEGTNIYADTIESLVAMLNAEGATPPPGQSGGTPDMKPEDIPPYKYSLKALIKAKNNSEATGDEKDWSFLTDGAGGPSLLDFDFDAKQYTLAREKALLAADLMDDKAAVKKVFTEESQMDKEEKKKYVKENAWTVAKRVTLGRVAYMAAMKNGIRLGSRMPVDIPTVGSVAAELGSGISKMPTDSSLRMQLDAWRAIFAELYNNGESPKSAKEAAEGSDSGSFLKSLGIKTGNNDFTNPGPSIKVPGSTTETMPAFFNATANTPEDILKIVQYQFMAKRAQQFAGALNEEDKEDLTVTGGKLYTVNQDGTKTLRKEEETIPKSYADIFDIALSPENIFPDNQIRQKYIDKLISFYTTGADAQGRALFTAQMSEPYVSALTALKGWYAAQDSVLNTGRKPEELTLFKQVLTSIKEGNGIDDSLQKILNEKGISPDILNQINANMVESGRAPFQEANAFLTQNRFGELPTLERMISLLNVQAAEAEEEAKKPAEDVPSRRQLSRGGVVYASTGKLINFQPRGTDTVPAMLTPGEFVVNRSATQKNLPVLQAINSGTYSHGDLVKQFSVGGMVPGYYQTGGNVSGGLAGFDFSSFMSGIVGQLTSGITEAVKTAFKNAASANNASGGVSNNDNVNFDGIKEFTNKLERISNTLASLDIPKEIIVTGRHEVNVIINGDDALSRLSPNIKDMVMTELQKSFEQLVSLNQPVPTDSLRSPFS